MYTHVVYTSITILNCPSVSDSDGSTSAVRKGLRRGGERERERERERDSDSLSLPTSTHQTYRNGS